MHALHPLHRLVLTEPDRPAAVGVFFDGEIRGHEGAGPMVLRPVELDAAADPWTRQPHQGWLDDVLAVDEVVAIGFVAGQVDASAQFRQDHQADELVLQVHRRPGPRLRLIGDAIVER